MTNYTWFPVTGSGTAADPYTWNVGTLSFDTGSYWADVDANPPYPIITGTVPGATVAGVAQDSIYIFAGQASGPLVDLAYHPDPSKGDPFIAKGGDGNYDFATDVRLSTGSVAVQTLALEEINFQATTPFVPILDIEGATLDVQGPLLSTYDTGKFPAGLSTVVQAASGAGVPQPGGSIIVGGGGTLEVAGSIDNFVTVGFG